MSIKARNAIFGVLLFASGFLTAAVLITEGMDNPALGLSILMGCGALMGAGAMLPLNRPWLGALMGAIVIAGINFGLQFLFRNGS